MMCRGCGKAIRPRVIASGLYWREAGRTFHLSCRPAPPAEQPPSERRPETDAARAECFEEVARSVATEMRVCATVLESLGPRHSRSAAMARRAVEQAERDGLLEPEDASEEQR